MAQRNPRSLQKGLFFLALCSTWALLPSCASTGVDAHKTPGSDLWMYHVYSWPSQDASTDSPDVAQQVRARVDLDLAKQGMTHLPAAGNPDFWILPTVTSQAIELEFKDARTGEIFWKGRSPLNEGQKALSADSINASVDHLIDLSIDAREWMTSSFWLKGIDI